jgi:hypothetical protein
MTISLTSTPNFAQFLFELLTLNGFAPCLLISIIKSTKWRFLSSLFINRSFNTFRSIQCEQFKEKLSEIGCWGQADRHFAAHYRLLLLIIDISKHGAKEMGHVKMAEPGFVNDVTAWWPGFVPKEFTTNRNQSNRNSQPPLFILLIKHFHNSMT